MSLKKQILEYLKQQNRFVNGGEIEDIARNLGFKASNSSRRCRELFNEGKIEREYKGTVYYRILERPPLEPKFRYEQVGEVVHLFKV
jgi:DNA-binding Lrp family transcriptional regulator